MAQYTTVAPIQILEMLDYHNLLGSHHLVLAHDVVQQEKRKRYSLVFDSGRMLLKGIRDRMIILDNGVAEHGSSDSTDIIAEAAAILDPEAIVLPDVPHDWATTFNLAVTSMNAIDEKLPPLMPRRFMYVIQGNHFNNYVRSIELMPPDRRIKHIGIPRNVVSKCGPGERHRLATICHQIHPGKNIHLLGFSDNMVDDLYSASNCHVQSIDSAVPLRVKDLFHLNMDVPPRKDTNWWDEGQVTDITIQNLVYVRNLFGTK